MVLSGLSPATAYHCSVTAYNLVTGANITQEVTFATEPLPGKNAAIHTVRTCTMSNDVRTAILLYTEDINLALPNFSFEMIGDYQQVGFGSESFINKLHVLRDAFGWCL